MSEFRMSSKNPSRYELECGEWQDIANDMMRDPQRMGIVTCYQVSLEQRKRMLARGERPMTYDEIIIELSIRANPGIGCRHSLSHLGKLATMVWCADCGGERIVQPDDRD